MKFLFSFFIGLFFLFSMVGNAFAITGNDAQNAGFHTVAGRNIHNSHHHKTHKVSSIDLSEEDDAQSVQNSLLTAVAIFAVVFPLFFKIIFTEKSIDFSRYEVDFKPNLRWHLLLQRITV